MATSETEERREYYDYRLDLQEYGFEHPSVYNKGGFLPVHIGDVLDDRYEVVDKLGNGGSGNVWLCHDRELVKWRAVKIFAADLQDNGGEEDVISYLQDVSSAEELKSNHINIPIDEFWITGPNGQHLCSVMTVHGCSVADWRLLCLKRLGKDTESRSRHVCRRIAEAVRFLHEKGICHNDIKPNNILMRVDNDALDKLSIEQMRELLGEPVTVEIELVSGEDPQPIAPEYSVAPNGIHRSHLLTDEVAFIDFGESFLVHEPKDSSGIPVHWAAPEILLNLPPSLGADIWSMACTMYQIRTDEYLFEEGCLQTSLMGAILKGIELLLGPWPSEYRSAWFRNRYNRLFRKFTPAETGPLTCSVSELDYDQELMKHRYGYPNTFSNKVGARRTTAIYEADTKVTTITSEWTYSREESLSFGDLLSKMLKYLPDERLSAADVCTHPWLTDIPSVPSKEAVEEAGKADSPVEATPVTPSGEKEPEETQAPQTPNAKKPGRADDSPATESSTKLKALENTTTQKSKRREGPTMPKSPRKKSNEDADDATMPRSPKKKSKKSAVHATAPATAPTTVVSASAKSSSNIRIASPPASPISPSVKATRSGRSYGSQ